LNSSRNIELAFAKHPLEQGVNLRYIQELLGHRSNTTGEIYTLVSQRSLAKIASPLDQILNSNKLNNNNIQRYT
jgi:integrase/recombinase XerD